MIQILCIIKILIYYLSGWRDPHGVLLIFKDDQIDNNGLFNEILYVREKNEYREMWDGRRLSLNDTKNGL